MSLCQTICTSSFGRHSHDAAYVAVVLSGGYEEAGDQGRFKVKAGDVILHDRFEAHLNRFTSAKAVVLNLPLCSGQPFRSGLAFVSDPDLIVREAESSLPKAAALLLSLIEERIAGDLDWPGELAKTLARNPDTRLGEWGATRGLAPWTLSRGFKQVFGLSPESYRARARARHALAAVRETAEPLAALAVRLGFSDQSHMCRSVKNLTGKAPRLWRSPANGFKTAASSRSEN